MNRKVAKSQLTAERCQRTQPNIATENSKSKQYKCEVCVKVFRWGSDLRKHLRIHTNERPFVCVHCNRKFRQSGNLKNHIAARHGSTAIFTCDYCNVSFPIKERLRLHMRLHSGERPYQCTMCPKAFARGGQIRQHMNSHYGIKKYKCAKCPASFTTTKYLLAHLKWHPNDEETKECKSCGNNIVGENDFKRHLSAFTPKAADLTFCKKCIGTFSKANKKLKPTLAFSCAQCAKRFPIQSQLTIHKRTHSGERPYQCQVCEQTYAHSSILSQHIRKHTGEKPYRCHLCAEKETAFSQLPHFKNHMRAIHGKDKAYMCNCCNKYYKTKSDLKNHLIGCVVPFKNPTTTEIETQRELTRLRLLVAVLLTKISSKPRLKQFGFEKRLIDNVLLEALKNAGHLTFTDDSLSDIDKLKANVKQFLQWSLPVNLMETIKGKENNLVELLNEITSITY